MARKLKSKTARHQVVVSGQAGRYPQCRSVEGLMQRLLRNEDLVTEEPARFGEADRFPEIPRRSGKVVDWAEFDAGFFGISDRLADQMDPQTRKACEVAYESILDAGLTVEEVRGCRTGIYYGSTHNEIDRYLKASDFDCEPDPAEQTSQDPACQPDKEEQQWRQQQARFERYYRQLGAQWLAYVLDVRGPFAEYESACSSVVTGLTDAFLALASGELDVALICGTNLNLSPHLYLEYCRLNLLSPVGACRFLDANGGGYVKSEAAVCLVLQRSGSPLLRRVQAIVRNADSNTDGYKLEGVTYPSSQAQERLIRRCFDQAGLDPRRVRYVEAHGTGTKAGDLVEMRALDAVFNEPPGRKHLLRVGSVKSNTGHAEAASGLISIAKVVTVFAHRQVPASIHFQEPNPKIESLMAGRLLPVQRNWAYLPKLVSLSSFGFGGSNVHLILEDPLSFKQAALAEQNGVANEVEDDDEDYVSNEEDTDDEQYGDDGGDDDLGSSIDLEDRQLLEKAISTFDEINGRAQLVQQCRLLIVSARTADGAMEMLAQLREKLEAGLLTEGDLQLLQRFAVNQQRAGFSYGGYLLYEPDSGQHELHVAAEPVCAKRNLPSLLEKPADSPAACPAQLGRYAGQPNNRPLIFVLPGLGCQWDQMGASLATLPFFRQRLQHYCGLVQPMLRFDLLRCLLDPPTVDQPRLSESIYCLLGLAVFEMALVDLLAELGVRPDACVGHSYGELLCGWIDGVFTDEHLLRNTLVLCETVKPGLGALLETPAETLMPITVGSMAVLNCGRERAQQLLNESRLKRVNVACDNTPDCVTIAGGLTQVEQALDFAEKHGVTGKQISTCEMAFHSELVNEYRERLITAMVRQTSGQCKRSAAWVSTSCDLSDPLEQTSFLLGASVRNKPTSSIDMYFVDCIQKPVQFRSAFEQIARDVQAGPRPTQTPLLLEIAPRRYVGPLAKALLPCELLPTLGAPRPGSGVDPNGYNVRPLLRLLGTLHELGVPVRLDRLYSTLDIDSRPVLGGLLSISSLVRWDHEKQHLFRTYPTFFNPNAGGRKLMASAVDCPLVKQRSAEEKLNGCSLDDSGLGDDALTVKSAPEPSGEAAPIPLGAIVRIAFELLCAAEQLPTVRPGCTLQLRQLSLFPQRCCSGLGKFELSLLPLAEDYGCKFDLHCEGLLFASGHCLPGTADGIEVPAEPELDAGERWTEIDGQSFYAGLTCRNYPDQQQLRLVPLVRKDLTGKRLQAALPSESREWSQQIEILLQMALSIQQQQVDRIDTVYLDELQVDTSVEPTASATGDAQACFDGRLASGHSTKVQLSGVSLLGRAWLNSEELQLEVGRLRNGDSGRWTVGAHLDGSDDRHHPYLTSLQLGQGRCRLRLTRIDGGHQTIFEHTLEGSFGRSPVHLLPFPLECLTSAYLLHSRCQLDRVQTALVCLDNFALTLCLVRQLCDAGRQVLVVLKPAAAADVTDRRRQLLQACWNGVHVVEKAGDIEPTVMRTCSGVDLLLSDSDLSEWMQPCLRSVAVHGQWVNMVGEACTSNKPLGLGLLLDSLMLVGVSQSAVFEVILKAYTANGSSAGPLWAQVAVKELQQMESGGKLQVQLSQLTDEQIKRMFNLLVISVDRR